MKVLFTTIEAHPVDSNIAAFRAAGHLAARKLLEVSG
jgi:hypothetical protein